MFSICDNKGFHITFENGLTLSTQFGGGNYCANYDIEIERYTRGLSCVNAEIAVLGDKRGDWYTREIMAAIGEPADDGVVGHVDIAKWLKIVEACKNYQPKEAVKDS